MISFILNIVYYLPTRVSLSYWFNLGSFLGISLVLQVLSGVFLILYYNSLERYERIIFIVMEVNYGWFMKIFHSNNASLVFALLYLHLFKNLGFFSYRLTLTWISGLIIIVLIIGAGFRGYVLVGSQIRLWAAIVITSLIRVIPIVGETLIYMVWRGYTISWVTIQILTLIHFILPFLVLIVILIHLISLHKRGRTRIIFSHSGIEKIPFYPYYWVKDIINVIIYILFLVLILIYPYSLGEVELFEEANILNSPLHIVPEWYFCTSYAILRRVPSKGIGVILIALSIGILFLYPLRIGYVTPPTNLRKFIWSISISLHLYLTYLGFSPIAQPYILISLWATLIYFIFHLGIIILNVISTYFFNLD